MNELALRARTWIRWSCAAATSFGPAMPCWRSDEHPDDVAFTEDGLTTCIDLVDAALRAQHQRACTRRRLADRHRHREFASTRPRRRPNTSPSVGHAARRRHLRDRRRHRRIRRGYLDRARADRRQRARHHAVADTPRAIRHRPDRIRHRRFRQRGTVRRGQRGAATPRPRCATASCASPPRTPGVDLTSCSMDDDGVRCGDTRLTLDELLAAAGGRGIRFTESRKAYGSPRSVTSNAHGFRIAVHRGHRRDPHPLQRAGRRRRRRDQPGAGARPDRRRRGPGDRLRADRELPRRRATA